MKNLLKKISPILKRSVALVGVIMVILVSLAMPSFAIDKGEIFGGSRILTPLFDYDYINIVYDNGDKYVYNLKDVFYNTFFDDREANYKIYDSTGETFITLTLSNMDFFQTRILVDGSYVTLPYWVLRFTMPIEFVTNFSVGCRESIYDASYLLSVFNNYYDNIRFLDSNGDYSDTFHYDYHNDCSFYYPEFTYDVDNILIGRSLKTKNISSNVSNASGSMPLGPNVDINSLVDYLPSDVPAKYCYFSDFTSHFQLSSNTDLPSYAEFNVCYIPSDDVVSFREYKDIYFPSYRYDSGSVDFTGWLMNGLTGFLSFEFLPGVTFSALLAFIFGLGVFFAFLRYFAGG